MKICIVLLILGLATASPIRQTGEKSNFTTTEVSLSRPPCPSHSYLKNGTCICTDGYARKNCKVPAMPDYAEIRKKHLPSTVPGSTSLLSSTTSPSLVSTPSESPTTGAFVLGQGAKIAVPCIFFAILGLGLIGCYYYYRKKKKNQNNGASHKWKCCCCTFGPVTSDSPQAVALLERRSDEPQNDQPRTPTPVPPAIMETGRTVGGGDLEDDSGRASMPQSTGQGTDEDDETNEKFFTPPQSANAPSSV